MFQQRFSYLISREIAHEITQEELAELQQLLAEDAMLKEKYAAFKKLQKQQKADKQPNVEMALQNVWNTIKQQENIYSNTIPGKVYASKNISRAFAAAAIVVLIAGAAYFLRPAQNADENTAGIFSAEINKKDWQEKQNSNGIRSYITLSDGSKIWLNADSKLNFPKAFEGKTRDVYLSGEAFFEVAKNPERPFIIHLDNGTVKVLGTSFNIKAYKGSNVVETSVSTGRVAFIPKKINNTKNIDTIFLTHDLKAVYSLQTEDIKTYSTISNDDMAWTDGKLIFKGLKFGEIATQLERSFGKQIVFTDDEVKNYTLTGAFENNSLSEILYYFSISKPFTYTISDKEILISKSLDH